VYLAKKHTEYLPIMGKLAIIPMIGFFYIFFTNSRKTGDEVFGEKIWWNHLRPIHGTLYAVFVYMALKKDTNAWIPLLLDVMIGLSSFLLFHYKEGNFKKLLED
jgi:hypothetical protein